MLESSMEDCKEHQLKNGGIYRGETPPCYQDVEGQGLPKDAMTTKHISR